jgi:hypothetical protein
MARSNRGGKRGGSGRNNNPEGRNQYSGMANTARDNPLVTAAAVGGAVAAGVFLWSRRNEISDKIANLADQISEWREGMGSEDDFAAEDTTSGETFMRSSGSRTGGGGRSQAQISEEALTLKETGKTA